MSKLVMLSIQIDNGKKIAKKISVEQKLSDLRNILKDKIPKLAIFTLKDGTEIDSEDEAETKINEIVDGKKIYMKIQKDPNEIYVEIFVNKELKDKKNLSKKIELKKVREILSKIMKKETYFITDEGAEIELNDEEEVLLEDVLDGNKLNIKSTSIDSTQNPIGTENKSEEIIIKDEKIKEEKKIIEIYLDDELKYNKKLLNTEKLIDVRKLLSLKVSQDFDFISKKNNNIISKSEENNLKLYQLIEDENKLYLLSTQNVEKKESGNTIEIFLNDKLFFKTRINVSEKLSTVRKILGKKIPKNCLFVFPNGLKIEDDEDEYLLEEIINNNKLDLYCDENDKNIPKELPKNNETEIQDEKPAKPPEYKPNIPLNDIVIENNENLIIYKYPEYTFTPEEVERAKKILVIGPTGSGKTTLLNSYVNYLMKINYIDNFRYKIIDETTFGRSQIHSQTTEVTYYNIKTPEGKLYQIIDTPGFGDTKGIKEDQKITEKITDFFLNKLNEVNAVCLVVKSTENRLAACQNYIFNCVFDLFGEDTKDIFIAMLTFTDGGKPPVLNFLKDPSSLFSQIVKKKEEHGWYFKFNNSSIFEKDIEDPLNLTYWNIGMDSFAKFTKKLDTLPKITLDQTKKVLNERSRLTKTVSILSSKLTLGLNKSHEIKEHLKIISELKGDIKDSKNFKKTIKVPAVKKIPVTEKGKYMTTCIICMTTCHRNCNIAVDEDKDRCACIGDNGNCIKCKNKCHWTSHKNRPFELVDVMEDKVITMNELKNKYWNSRDKLDMKSQLLMGAKNELVKLNLECLQTQQEIMMSINRLKEIALNKSMYESTEEYIDELIQNEKSQHDEGWQTRVNGLLAIKEQKRQLREMSQGKFEGSDQMKKIIEDSILNEEALKEFIENNNVVDEENVKEKCKIY